ncbi:LytR family transcriptional regulator [Pseudoclavibacter sp. AY1F1]|uniref:LCP family protein n=1 Tax=Pseudoclavibacter sp. AY1F1 TaxID=2080583 RepID=UPI000CE7B046|nr:LCP family protein [Pseudoclavibacter sp. AY1F1]PPF41791.1 LytR family transcriptional regulator [Pseudoclavibacter sp. AY1F1]
MTTSRRGGSSAQRFDRAGDDGILHPDARGGVAQHGRLPVTTAAGSLGKGALVALSVVLVSVLSVGGIALAGLIGNLDVLPDPGGDNPPIAFDEIEGGFNVLLVGSDDRTGQGAAFGEGDEDASGVLNDVNMLLHVSADRTHASVVSIPRDTMVDQPACTNDQGVQMEERFEVPMNSILGEGGMGCVVETVEAMSGLDIPYAAMVKFLGVIEMSNAVGGVDVCVANEISDDYVGLYLQPGNYSLQGEDALKFLRTRHGVGGSDLQRIANQQVFLSSLIREVKSAGTLTDAGKLYGLGQAATRNMTMTKSLAEIPTLMGMASALNQVDLAKISFVQLPTADYDGARVMPLEPEATRMWDLLAADQPLTVAGAPTGEDGAVGEDGTGDGGAGEDAATDAPVDPNAPAATPAPTFAGQAADQESCSNPTTLFG